NIVLLTEINGFFDASLLHNYMDVIFVLHNIAILFLNMIISLIHYCHIYTTYNHPLQSLG
ncbi:citrate transporter, partial [Enterococcus faecium]